MGLAFIPCPNASAFSIFIDNLVPAIANASSSLNGLTTGLAIGSAVGQIAGTLAGQANVSSQVGQGGDKPKKQIQSNPQHKGLDGVNGISEENEEIKDWLDIQRQFLKLRKKSWRHAYANLEVNDLTGETRGTQTALGDDLVGQAFGLYASWKFPIPFLSSLKFGGRKIIEKTRRFAFWSGEGAEAAALKAGFKTIGETNAGKNLAKLTKDMVWDVDSEAYKMWARISSKLASSYPKNSKAHVFITEAAKKNLNSIWNRVEKPILEANGVKIIYHPVL